MRSGSNFANYGGRGVGRVRPHYRVAIICAAECTAKLPPYYPSVSNFPSSGWLTAYGASCLRTAAVLLRLDHLVKSVLVDAL